MILKLGMQHRALQLYKVCINGDPGLTVTYFMATSNLFSCAFEWEKFYKVIKWEKLAADYQIKKKIYIFEKKLTPGVLSAPAPGIYICI